MDILLGNFFSFNSFLYLTGLIAAAFFFAMVGIRELKSDRHEGLVYVALAIFFIAAHVIMLFSNFSSKTISDFNLMPGAWEWLILLLGPALVTLYILFGLFSFVKLHVGEAILKIGLGVSLIGILYFAGLEWPQEVRAMLVIIFGITWFGIELRTVGELE
nr:hypothetical protein [candidate division Zixibacteria bacterium]